MAKTGKDDEVKTVLYRDDINDAKADERRKHLLATLEETDFAAHYEVAHPTKQNRYSFRPSNVGADYQSWLKTSELSETSPSLGILENRKESLIDIERLEIQDRFQRYFDSKLTWDELKALDYGFTKDAARYDAKATREKLLNKESYNEQSVRKILMRPFDERWCYYTTSRPLWNEPRPAYVKQLRDGNLTFVTRKQSSSVREGSPIFISRQIGFQHALSTDAYFTPMLIHSIEEAPKTTNQISMFDNAEPKEETKANLSAKARAYLENLGLNDADENAETASLVWYHALAVGYSPLYLAENADGIRQDFPRIPLPAKLENLQASAKLGKRIAALLDTETPVASVTAGKLDAPFASIGALAHSEGGQLQPEDFEITAGWGHAGKGGVTMPAKGKLVERDYTEIEINLLNEAAARLGVTLDEIKEMLGATTFDIYLNNFAYWRNVPRNVWEYTIGGYQVIKKWLSYREIELLGRALTLAEANEVRDMSRRISAILLSTGDLDENYLTAKASNAVTNESTD